MLAYNGLQLQGNLDSVNIYHRGVVYFPYELQRHMNLQNYTFIGNRVVSFLSYLQHLHVNSLHHTWDSEVSFPPHTKRQFDQE